MSAAVAAMELRSRARDRSTHRLIYHQLLVTGFTDGGESRRKEQGALSYGGEVTFVLSDNFSLAGKQKSIWNSQK